MACLKNKYYNTSRQRRADTDADVFISACFQVRDEVSDLGEVVSNERLTAIILDALPTDKGENTKIQGIRGPDLCLEEVNNMMKTIFINHSERSSASKRNHQSYRKSRDSGREPTMNGRESALATFVTCHNCKRPGHIKQDCN